MASKQVIEKLLGSLLFEPNGVKFEVKDSSSSNSEFKSYLIDVYVDPNRFHRIGDDYDPQYSKFINELDDNVYETLKYVGGDDIDYSIQFKHLDPKFKKKLDDILRSLFKKIDVSKTEHTKIENNIKNSLKIVTVLYSAFNWDK
jgi:hypothetical protein